MADKRQRVFKPGEWPAVESPDGATLNSVIVTEESCGATDLAAGWFSMRPGFQGYVDLHQVDELYCMIQGQGTVTIDDEPHRIEAGDVVLIPGGSPHYVTNDGEVPIVLLWVAGRGWSGMTEIREALSTWRPVPPDQAVLLE